MSRRLEALFGPGEALQGTAIEEGALGTAGRILLNDFYGSTAFIWSMVAAGCTFLVLCFGSILIWMLCRRKRSKVEPIPPPMPKAGLEKPVEPQQQAWQQQEASPLKSAPAPPGQTVVDSRAGIALAAVIPGSIMPFTSNPRPASAPQYERLVMISSRVHNHMRVAASVLPNVAVLVYDWKNFTLQELVRFIKKILGGQKVTSIAVLAPHEEPGGVGLLENHFTTADQIKQTGELSQFWRVLAGCVAPNGAEDGRRVDLLGCRTLEAPRQGAALLKELWKLTAVPFAAADDALGGYQLSTFMEEPTSGQLSIISSTIKGIDIYFNRELLLGSQAVAAMPKDAYAPALPAGAPPQTALQVAAPPPQASGSFAGFPQQQQVAATAAAMTAAGAVGGAAMAGAAVAGQQQQDQQQQQMQQQQLMQQQQQQQMQQQQQQYMAPVASAPLRTAAEAKVANARATAVPKQDIFQRFASNAAARGMPLETVYEMADTDGSGQLNQEQVVRMVQNMVPDATPADIQHFRAMMDLDGNNMISLHEFLTTLRQNQEVHNQVRVQASSGQDTGMLMATLRDYLTEHDAILRQIFNDNDANGNGSLDHGEVASLVSQIPELTTDEQKFIISYLYQNDINHDGSLTFDEFKAIVHNYGQPATVTTAHHNPGPGAPQPAGARSALPPPPQAPPSGPAPMVYTLSPVQAAQPAQTQAMPVTPFAFQQPAHIPGYMATPSPQAQQPGMMPPAASMQPQQGMQPMQQQPQRGMQPGMMPPAASMQPVASMQPMQQQPQQGMQPGMMPQAASMQPMQQQPQQGMQPVSSMQPNLQPVPIMQPNMQPAQSMQPSMQPAQSMQPVPGMQPNMQPVAGMQPNMQPTASMQPYPFMAQQQGQHMLDRAASQLPAQYQQMAPPPPP